MRVATEAFMLVLLLVTAQAAISPAPAPATEYYLGRAGYALGPAQAAYSPRQAPLSMSSDNTQPARPLPCRASNSSALGAYKPVTTQSEKDGIGTDLAPAAWQSFTQNQAITGCTASTVQPVSYNVTRACKQAVAGTNYAFQFEAFYDCTTPMKTPTFGSVNLRAVVFQPLPQQGQNAPPQVDSVWNITKA